MYTKNSDAYNALSDKANTTDPLKFILEVYINDYNNLAILRCKRDLDHIANAMMHGMHSVFPADDHGDKDPMLVNKLFKKDGQWDIAKYPLGWMFKEIDKSMVLEEKKILTILATLKEWLRSKRREFQTAISTGPWQK